ncbi:molybdopterin-synthase adenylyltransferase MoeB [Vampirovibrio chlorellavorus]|uniref:molybdopterin-synthase adenylyltransferase MoeB n=1 Tax=Vampirovibrio chlorellavorus TaxID=758823 RepID=UPI0026ED556C|nr:molybdopterin-synthase adenylyltransferase MoeB [Vampirovibrio chlorellavorus]
MTFERASLTPEEQAHYSRHLKLKGFGLEKQLRLKKAKVLLVGAGGLGCPAGLYLAAAGVGTLGVVDFDRVERSNLQRQIAHRVENIGQSKVESLIAAMRAINPNVTYQPHAVAVDETNVMALIAGYDLVLDGSDNFATRFLVADACYLARIPLLQGAVFEYGAQLALFDSGQTACYRCVFEEPPQSNVLAPCAEVGVLGVVPGTVGVMMATEAIKYLTGLGDSIQGKLLIYKALSQSLKTLQLVKNPECPLCGEHPSIWAPQAMAVTCAASEELMAEDLKAFELSPEAFQSRLAQGWPLVDVREAEEFAAGHLPQAENMPLSGWDDQIWQARFELDEPVLLYCQKGVRSLKALQQLRSLGYQQVYSLTGGLSGWNGPLV